MESAPGTSQTRPFWTYRGPDGVRSGWSMLIFVLIFAAVTTLFVFFDKFVLHITGIPKDEIGLGLGMIFEGTQLLTILITVGLMSRIEGRRFISYGLEQQGWIVRYVIGLFGGWCCLSLLIVLLYASGYLVLDGVALAGVSALGYALGWLVVFSMTGVIEELMWRGYIQTTLTRGMGFWPAAVLGSLLFATAHISNSGETALGVAQVFVAGMIFCVILRISGSLWLGIGVHAGWDWGQSYFYGTPDSGILVAGHLLNSHPQGAILFSGGTVGPEGSVLSTPAFFVGLLVLLWVCKRAGLFAKREASPASQPAT